jgi:hypothetical protein
MTADPVRLADRAGVPRAGACIREGTRPEVDGERARHDVALDYAIFESHVAGRLVTIAEVELGAVGAYQWEIDEQLGLISSPDRAGRPS